MIEQLLQYAQNRLSAPQYDEFCKVIKQEPGVSAGTKIYWLEVAEVYFDTLGYSDAEIKEFFDARYNTACSG
jgi:hypothetical protein